MVFSRLPVAHAVWIQLGVFRNGDLDDFAKALDKFLLHFNTLALEHRASLSNSNTNKNISQDGERIDGERIDGERIDAEPSMAKHSGPVLLELGPGDSVVSCLIGHALGAAKTIMVDQGNYANRDMDYYRRYAHFLREQGFNAPDLSDVRDFDDLLHVCNGVYLTGGLASLRSLEDQQFDLFWSHSVLEHIRLNEFAEMLQQMHRLLKTGGRLSHSVDYMDHLGRKLNNLRFPQWLWESEFMANSGFYTNRIRNCDMEALFVEAGFSIESHRQGRWPQLPTAWKRMDKQFQSYSDDELKIRTANIVLSK
jgi:SAM-dependent methyltransferase